MAKNEAALGAFTAHREAVEYIVNKILAEQPELAKIQAVGHRIVHGGEKFTRSGDHRRKRDQRYRRLASLAPCNPAHLIGIPCSHCLFPKLPQVAVFDTAFHQSMPDQSLCLRPAFTSYTANTVSVVMACMARVIYSLAEAAKMLNKPIEETNVICAHLGNGVSDCHKGGKVSTLLYGFNPIRRFGHGHTLWRY